MQKEEIKLQKRLLELSKISYQRDIAVFSSFLNLNELNILHTTAKDQFSSNYKTFGGYVYAERQMVSFLPDALYFSEYDKHIYPIKTLRVRPLQKKFSEELTHRDYLGAILNLGIDRSKVGDILVFDKESIIFVEKNMAPFIIDSFSRIKHTAIQVEEVQDDDFDYKPSYKEIKSTVASIRLDSILSLVFPLSRSKMTGLIEGAKVYVNGRLITTNSYQLKEEDIISVRGMGKFVYKGALSVTKKGRHCVVIHKYV